MKRYVRSNISTELHHMSKENLESVVSKIAYTVKDGTLSNTGRLAKISSILSRYNLR